MLRPLKYWRYLRAFTTQSFPGSFYVRSFTIEARIPRRQFWRTLKASIYTYRKQVAQRLKRICNWLPLGLRVKK